MGQIHQHEIQENLELEILTAACGITTPCATISDLVTAFIRDKYDNNILRFSNASKVHRNFIIDIAKGGKYPKIRNGHQLADVDNRYNMLGEALGLAGEKLKMFIAIVYRNQSLTKRRTGYLMHGTIDILIIELRADILRSFPNLDSVKIEEIIANHRKRLLAIGNQELL